MNLKLDVITDDLALEGNTLVFTSDLATLVVQRLKARFRTFRGEWFRDAREGIPYFDQVLVKNPSAAAVRTIFRNVIATTPGVAQVLRLTYTLNNRTRSAEIDFEAQLDTGVTLTAADFGPFILEF